MIIGSTGGKTRSVWLALAVRKISKDDDSRKVLSSTTEEVWLS